MIYSDIFYLFLIISFGYILGNFNIRGFSLNVFAMLIIALIVGHYGLVVSEKFKFFGLAIFIYTVGLQSCLVIFKTIKTEGLKLNILAILLILMIFSLIVTIGLYLGLKPAIIDSIFTGLLSSIPSLTAVLEIKNDPNISVLFDMIYPFGIVTIVLFVRFVPFIFKVDIQKEIKDYEQMQKSKYPEVLVKNFKITNESIKQDGIKKSKLKKMTDTIIHKIKSKDKNQKDLSDKILYYSDIIRASGIKENLEHVDIMADKEVKNVHSFYDDMKVYRLLVILKNIIGKKISDIKELKSYRVVIAKIRRSGIDISPYLNMTLMLGDKLYVVAPKKYANKITTLMGNNLQKYPLADFLPMSLGVVFGILLGKINRIKHIVWQMSYNLTTLIKTLGQFIFIVVIGINVGKYLLKFIKENCFMPIYIGLFSLIFSLLAIIILYRYILKMNFLKILELLSGSTTSLTMVNNLTKSDYSFISYAAVYPLALVLAIVMTQFSLKAL